MTVEGSEASAAAIRRYNQEHGTAMLSRRGKSLNVIARQGHRAVERGTRPIQGGTSCKAAHWSLTGRGRVARLRKGQIDMLPTVEQALREQPTEAQGMRV